MGGGHSLDLHVRNTVARQMPNGREVAPGFRQPEPAVRIATIGPPIAILARTPADRRNAAAPEDNPPAAASDKIGADPNDNNKSPPPPPWVVVPKPVVAKTSKYAGVGIGKVPASGLANYYPPRNVSPLFLAGDRGSWRQTRWCAVPKYSQVAARRLQPFFFRFIITKPAGLNLRRDKV